VGERIHAHAGSARQVEGVNHAGRRRERFGVLGVDAALDRVAGERDVALLEAEAHPRGDADLLLHDVYARDHLGDGVLHLETRVRLHVIELPLIVHQELERAGVGVLHGLGRVHHQAAHLAPHLLRQDGRRRFLDQLLVAPLDRALALAEVHHVAVMVADDLELDVAGVVEILLDVDVAVAEGRLRLALRRPEVRAQFVRVAHHAHAAPAAAGHRFDDHREADALGHLERGLFAVHRTVAAGQHGRPAFFMALRARALSPSSLITLGSGPMNRMWQAPHTSAR
jgi:hypothetical protein